MTAQIKIPGNHDQFHAVTAGSLAAQQLVGLRRSHPEPSKFLVHLRGTSNAAFGFCRAIVGATADPVCTYKPQNALFTAPCAEDALERLIAHIHQKRPACCSSLMPSAATSPPLHGTTHRSVGALPRRCDDAQSLPGLRSDPTLSRPCRQGRYPAPTHLKPWRRGFPGATVAACHFVFVWPKPLHETGACMAMACWLPALPDPRKCVACAWQRHASVSARLWPRGGDIKAVKRASWQWSDDRLPVLQLLRRQRRAPVAGSIRDGR